ncbi:nucleoside-diphosphate sugar epimerase/dehydratase [Cupriavidus metallidurans]|uniref:polysaccharide biosynthesis protein n=1 Tax=Cupriavidus metallidurans TaxID=119219 RepID=UPI003D7586D4
MLIQKSIAPLLALPRSAKRLVVVLLDLVLSLISVWAAFYLRIDQTGLPQQQQVFAYLLAPILAFPIFVRLGLYRAIFRYTGMAALASTAKAVGIYGLLFFAALLAFNWSGVPRSVGLIQPMLFLLLVGASRAMARFWLAGSHAKFRQNRGRLLIYGAGEAGVQTASALGVTRQFVLLGFIDEDKSKVGRTINGMDIIGPDDVAHAIEQMGVTDILLAMPSLGRARRNSIIAKLRELPVHVRTLPGMVDLASGKVTVRDFQELDVEDLLGRVPVPPDETLLARNLFGKTVLVTGAGGSIGSELCRQIIMERPKRLVLVDHNEFGLYAIHHELEGMRTKHRLTLEIVPLLASVANLGRLREICQIHRPATVYHAAAYKHVPLVEHNPSEGVLNNVFGTINMARAAVESHVDYFVLVSTDKAVRPTNVMGASKRMAELVLQAFAASQSLDFGQLDCNAGDPVRNGTVFAMVRFGNVLGSSGSVVPLFRRQLSEGGPLTVTHEEVTRYFMTIPEAAQLVLQAGAMAQGGEVFVLDMGQPVKIMDLAKRMIQLSGLSIRDERNPDGDIEIRVTGLRPGEKLYEELLIGDNPETTAHERIMMAREDFLHWSEFAPVLVQMRRAAEHNDERMIKEILARCVHGYGGQEEGSAAITVLV